VLYITVNWCTKVSIIIDSVAVLASMLSAVYYSGMVLYKLRILGNMCAVSRYTIFM